MLREIESPGTGKTQFRLLLTPQPVGYVAQYGWSQNEGAMWHDDSGSHRLTYWAGDAIAVRERAHRAPDLWVYSADDVAVGWPQRRVLAPIAQDSISAPHLAVAASRITLQVTDVDVQRLQDITDDDAVAEGVITDEWREWREDATNIAPPGSTFETERDVFAKQWNTGRGRRAWNGPGGWDANPFVVAYTFRPVLANIHTIP